MVGGLARGGAPARRALSARLRGRPCVRRRCPRERLAPLGSPFHADIRLDRLARARRVGRRSSPRPLQTANAGSPSWRNGHRAWARHWSSARSSRDPPSRARARAAIGSPSQRAPVDDDTPRRPRAGAAAPALPNAWSFRSECAAGRRPTHGGVDRARARLPDRLLRTPDGDARPVVEPAGGLLSPRRRSSQIDRLAGPGPRSYWSRARTSARSITRCSRSRRLSPRLSTARAVPLEPPRRGAPAMNVGRGAVVIAQSTAADLRRSRAGRTLATMLQRAHLLDQPLTPVRRDLGNAMGRRSGIRTRSTASSAPTAVVRAAARSPTWRTAPRARRDLLLVGDAPRARASRLRGRHRGASGELDHVLFAGRRTSRPFGSPRTGRARPARPCARLLRRRRLHGCRGGDQDGRAALHRRGVPRRADWSRAEGYHGDTSGAMSAGDRALRPPLQRACRFAGARVAVDADECCRAETDSRSRGRRA